MAEYIKVPRLGRRPSAARLRRVGDSFQLPGGGVAIPGTVTASRVTDVDNNYQIVFPDAILLVTTGAAGKTLTLPSAAAYDGSTVKVRKVDTGAGFIQLVPTTGDFFEYGSTVRLLRSTHAGLTVVAKDGIWYDITDRAMSPSANATVSAPTFSTTLAPPVTTALYTTGASDKVFTLPAALTYQGVLVTIKKIDAGAGKVTITPDGSETIENAASYDLTTQHEGVILLPHANKWYIAANV